MQRAPGEDDQALRQRLVQVHKPRSGPAGHDLKLSIDTVLAAKADWEVKAERGTKPKPPCPVLTKARPPAVVKQRGRHR